MVSRLLAGLAVMFCFEILCVPLPFLANFAVRKPLKQVNRKER